MLERYEIAEFIDWVFLVWAFAEGNRSVIILSNFFQLIWVNFCGGKDDIEESDIWSSTELWFEDSSFKFVIWIVCCGNLVSAMSKTSGLWYGVPEKYVDGVSGAIML